MSVSNNASRHLLLSNNRSELRKRLVRIRSDKQRAEAPLEADFAEQAVQRENDEVLDRLESSVEAELIQIERALSRIDLGQGEVCSECGRAIEAARLSALPYATECVACAKQHDTAAA